MTAPTPMAIWLAVNRNLAIILVGPQGSANIGATARAMKNFGIGDLRLVDTASHLSKESLDWAVDAKDVLQKAGIYASLNEALTDLPFSAAFTRRLGRSRRRHLILPEAAPLLAMKIETGGAALVFGREDAGLTNDEVSRCDAVIEIPTSSDFPSINLAQSVILAIYEISKGLSTEPRASDGRTIKESFLPKERILPVIEKLDAMLLSLGYENIPGHPLRTKVLDQFEKLFGRGGLTRRDTAMFDGLIERIRRKTSQ